MSYQVKSRFKPVFKQFIKLRENVQKRQKLLKFKKKKWKPFLKFYLNRIRRFRKFKPLDHSKYFVTKYGVRGVGYRKRYRDTLHAGKRLRLLYGNLRKKYFQKIIKTTLKRKKPNSKNLSDLGKIFLERFEKRLDITLYKAKFAPTIRSAQQLIVHGKVSVNGKPTQNKTYILVQGDVVSLNFNCVNLYENHTFDSTKWPIPPKHLVINYRTLQILFLNDVRSNSMAVEFPYNLRLQKILVNYPHQ